MHEIYFYVLGLIQAHWDYVVLVVIMILFFRFPQIINQQNINNLNH